ncbi:MAG: glycosyltransferase [Xanthobacteraceae bacterium]|nr:glycosyltransferase [Xanthobacteraceae bacterium]
MQTILHISADFPNPLAPSKTKAVQNLIGATEGFRHVVYSLNRVNGRGNIAMMNFGEDRTAVAYGAPPYGLMLERFLVPVGEAIARDIERRGVVPSLIHAHKFTIDGLVASVVSDLAGTPFVASLWGDTDCKIVEAKRGMNRRFRKLARQAERLLPAAPWTERYFMNVLGLDGRHFHLLPVMTTGDRLLKPVLTHPQRLVTVFALDAWRRKGLDRLLDAIAIVARTRPDIVLDIYGSGSPKSLIEVTGLAQASEVAPRVRLKGVLPHGEVQRVINGYSAFVMAPRRETYGMVHVEALLAGVPILWSENRGIDGYFDGHDVGTRCDPNSAESIAKGILFLLANERRLKQNIAALQADGLFEPLRRAGIADNYREILAAHAGEVRPEFTRVARQVRG